MKQPFLPNLTLGSPVGVCLLLAGLTPDLQALGPVIPVVNSFTELRERIDRAWTNNTQAVICPPGFAYTEDVGLVSFSSSFPIQLLFPTPPAPENGITTYTLSIGETNSSPLQRVWSSSLGVVTNTAPPSEYDSIGWVLATHAPPAYLDTAKRNEWIAEWMLPGRQTLRSRLISTNDVAAYQALLANRAASTPAPVATNEIGAVSIQLTPGGQAVEVLLQVPLEVDRVGVYEKDSLTPAGPWRLLGQLAHTSDPVAYLHALQGQGKVLMFANHLQDRDGDALPDAFETLVLGTEAEWGDSDDDGLSDFEEAITYRTNPTQRDSDGDGVMDSTEVHAGYDPNLSQAVTRFDLARLLGLPPMELTVQAAFPNPFTTTTLFDGPLTENGLDPGATDLAPAKIAARAQAPAHDGEETYVSLENLASGAEEVAIRMRMHSFDPGGLADYPIDGSGYCNGFSFALKGGTFTGVSTVQASNAGLQDPPLAGGSYLSNAACFNQSTNTATAGITVEVVTKVDLPTITLTPTDALDCACNRILTFTATVVNPNEASVFQNQIVWEISGSGSTVYGPLFAQNSRRRLVTKGSVREVQVRTGELGGDFILTASLEDLPVAATVEFRLLKIDVDVDTNRDGEVHVHEDELGEDSFNWNVGRGAWIAPRKEVGYTSFDQAPLPGLSELKVRPTVLPPPEGWTMRLRADDASALASLKIFDDTRKYLAFDGQGVLPFAAWPTNGVHYYAASHYSKKQTNNIPNQLDLWLEVLDEAEEVQCADKVRFKVAPILLPPECNPPEAIYSLEFVGMAGVTHLEFNAGANAWLQDMVKFGKIQLNTNSLNTSAILLGHPFDGNVPQILRNELSLPGPVWAVDGDGGNMMATPPLPGAPLGKILLGTKGNLSKPYWEAQGLQPVVPIATEWLAVGHVDEVLMWVAPNKVLYASPWKAADLLHEEIAAGNGVNTIWTGLVNDASKVKTIESVVIAKTTSGVFKRSILPAGGLSAGTTTISIPSHPFAQDDRLRVDDEVVVVTGVSGNSLTLQRGLVPSRPAADHAAGEPIYAYSDLMKINLPIGPAPDPLNSVTRKMEVVIGELTAACDNQVPFFVALPVLFDHHPQGGGLTATTSNPVNCLLTTQGVIRYSQTGCNHWENYIQSRLIGALPRDSWAQHCNAGEIHCATASIRSFPANPTWNKLKPNWE